MSEEEENNAQQPPKKPQRFIPSRQYAVIREGHYNVEGASVTYADTLDEAIDMATSMKLQTGSGWRIYAPLP